MYIDDFIWLPDILENSKPNIASRKMKLSKCSLTNRAIVLWKPGTESMKMSIQPVDKLMPVGM